MHTRRINALYMPVIDTIDFRIANIDDSNYKKKIVLYWITNTFSNCSN